MISSIKKSILIAEVLKILMEKGWKDWCSIWVGQLLQVIAYCLFMYDKGEKWSVPRLAAVLVLEHCLLAARFSLSWFAPEVLLYILVT